MASMPIGTGGDGAGGGADALEDVTLEHFTANPAAIGPFDHSLLSWRVNGIKPPVQVLLETTHVTATGQAVVQPAVTASYGLSAKAGPTRKFLGHVTVSVDTSTCDEVELLNLIAHLREQILIAITDRSDTYWPPKIDDPNILNVILSEGPLPRILIRATFRQRVAWFPDAWVTWELSFGLGIQDGAFVAVAAQSSGSVSFDLLTTLLGAAPLGVYLLRTHANDRASAAGLDMIAGLIEYINAGAVPSPGKSPRSAVVTHRDGKPFIGFVECSVGPQGMTTVLTDGVFTMPE